MSEEPTPEECRKQAAQYREYADNAWTPNMAMIFLKIAADFEKLAVMIEDRPPDWTPRPPRKRKTR
jgi:hypothetical protein